MADCGYLQNRLANFAEIVQSHILVLQSLPAVQKIKFLTIQDVGGPPF